MLKGNYLIRRDILFVFIAWYTYIYVGRFLYICQRERFKYVCTAENLTHQLNTFWQLHDFLCLVEPRKSIYLRRMILNPVNQFYNWTWFLPQWTIVNFFQNLDRSKSWFTLIDYKNKTSEWLQKQLKELFEIPLGLLSEELSGVENKTTIRWLVCDIVRG